MRQTGLEKALEEKLKLAIQDVTPGICVRAYHQGRLICDLQVGQTRPYYDFASLTKVFFTQQTMMQAFDQGLWTMESKVIEFLPDFFNSEMTVHSLLSHSSGLDWWYPFYKDIAVKNDIEQDWIMQRTKIYPLLNTTQLYKPTGKSVYSDLGFILLGFILERIYKKNILEIWTQTKELYYPDTSVDFNLNNKPLFDESLYAPTEECPVRKQVLRGIVHDENTWSFGGISTHAGLFGSIDDLSAMALNTRSQLMGIAKYKVRQKTAQFFSERAVPIDVGDWALGYMMPSAINASCGPHFSIHSIGHTGFTGTSFWFDPRHDILVLALSNRVNYGRNNRRYVNLRPQIHSWIFESIKRVI
jgi:CubicO group peptidase (beta-lactamase class C family)